MTEEIKLVTQALQNMSASAMWAFIAYLVLGKLLYSIICWMGGIILTVLICKRFLGFIESLVPACEIVKQIRDCLELKGAGYQNLWSDQIPEIRATLPKLIEAYKEKSLNSENKSI